MKLSESLIVAVLILAIPGCSVYMAANQPEKRNLSVLTQGTPRNQVIATLGTPVVSEIREGAKVDTFAFKQGYGKAAKTARAVGHGIADVFTLGLWELVGTPTELIASGRDVKIQVTYDENDRVKSTVSIDK